MTSHLNRRGFLKAGAAGVTLATMPGLVQMAQAQNIQPGGTLRLALNITPSVLNPMLSRLNSEYLLGELLYSGLTMLAADMSAQPDLATEWSANDDATEWHFVLRENAVFSNGAPVTSADVVATFAKLLDPETAAPGSRNLGPIAEVVADGDFAVIIRTSSPYADLPVALTYPTAKVLPASVIEGDFDSLMQTPLGSGPFRLAEYRPDDVAIVERNPDYFIDGQPYLDRVEVKTFPDAAGGAAALLAGEVDILTEIQPTDYARIAESDGVTGLRTPSGRFLDVVMDCTVEPFNNPKVREALSYCVDREAMVELVAEGYGTPGNDTPVNSAYRYNSEAPLRSYDPEKAKALLAEAGYPDGIEIELIASTKPGYRSAMAVVLREMAQPGGFDIAVQTMDHPTYLDQVWKKGKFYVGFYNMQPTEGTIFNLLFTSQASWNETRWNNADFDALVLEADQTTDESTRADLYAQAQKLMRDEVPALVPCFFDLLGARADYVENYVQNPRGANYALHTVGLAADAPTR
ncbi:ABC transporter substrate-binding protein [Puniceibacterium sp. IMCC21224]|uniref:ABC transporter substrate-binding protein n=1 Tax=Puniceibacterium sp. IMCC21224 TaxID=1618204 RepID=UPI00064DD445|nr:ABC transporter substrate-binding protein [Puniceibacterium sp. IMCC21224]KMK68501.1 ABC-type dipeptide transport system, periplasmic component [Puniceibacterium sp. IMCC21224]